MIFIQPMREEDCQTVARLHLNNLRTELRGLPGLNLLERYYRALTASRGGSGYVAKKNNQLVGFICGVWDANNVRQVLFRNNLAALFYWGLVHLLSNPRMFRQFWKQLRGHGRFPEEGYELRPIAVDRGARKAGVGKMLLEAILLDARQRGFTQIYLFTEEDNEEANEFYQHTGFQLMGKIKAEQISYLKYVFQLEQG